MPEAITSTPAASSPSPAAASTPSAGAAAPAPITPPHTAPAQSSPPATLADGAVPDGAAAAAAAAAAGSRFPDNWRDQLAGDDKTSAERLKRFASPGDLFKSYRELETKVSSGQLKAPATPFPATGTDEAKAEWRKTNGLPETAEAYVEKLALPNGVVIGEADKPLINEFAKDMHAAGATQDEMNRAMASYYRLQGVAEAQRAEADVSTRATSQTQLMTDWGPQDYKVNMNAVGTLLATMPEEAKVGLLSARTADGQMVGDTVWFNKWAAAHAREFNPAATLISPTQANAPQAISDEISAIEKVYQRAVTGDRDAHREYYGHAGKPGLDARERELIHAQEQMRLRGQRAA